jgi:KDO2-lipid IV(A) lauroyltransferase
LATTGHRLSSRERLTDLAYGVAWAGLGHCPDTLARNGFRLGADLAVMRGTAGTQQLRANLARVGPVDDDLVRDTMRGYARYWRELFALPRWDPARVSDAVRVTGRENLDEALAHGRGVILALPHMGNYDIGGLWLARNTGPFSVVAERLRPEGVYQRFVRARERYGYQVVPHSGGELPVLDVLLDRLARGGIVALLADRALRGSGEDVAFFGAPARFPTGPARLAAKTGAPVLPTVCSYEGSGWGLTFGKPLPANDITQSMADSFAAAIERRPQEWPMLARLWCADLKERP